MRLETPRVAPLDDAQIDAEVRERFGDQPLLNIFRTLAHHPKLLKRWLVFGNHVLGKSTLGARERELAILRVAGRCGAGYEWGHHVEIARATGVTDDEIARVRQGPSAGWEGRDRALLQAVDELHADTFISDETWATLAEHFDVPQVIDLIFTVGQYVLVSMALNSLGVQPEPGLPRLSDA